MPILFSGEMVLAQLDGRKTQTRRLCPVQPMLLNGVWHVIYPSNDGTRGHGMYSTATEMRAEYDRIMLARCPFRPGRTTWVRETLKLQDAGKHRAAWVYAADGAIIRMQDDDPRVPAMLSWAHHKAGSTCVSIHMPRWASRIQRLIVARRIERLQDITEEDARAEGVVWDRPLRGSLAFALALHEDALRRGASTPDPRECFARENYRLLWDELNGKRAPWLSNPFVRVITFAQEAADAR